LGDRKRLLPLVFVAVGLAVYFAMGPHWPKDQAVRFVLGDAAPRVVELDVRYEEAGARSPSPGEGEPAREVRFPYAAGSAPRIVSHEPRLANGDYIVQMELTLSPSSHDPSPGLPRSHVTLERHVRLEGGTTSIDLSQALLKGSESE
jgi:hypothetical protein